MNITKYTVSRDDSVFEAWPDLILTEKGKLICMFTECAAHMDRRHSRLVYCQSYDKGRTWSEKRPFTEYSGDSGYYNNCRMSKLSDHSLVVVCDFVNGMWENAADGSAVHMWRGDAEGENWSGPFLTPARGIVPDRLRELKCGRWILAAHSWNQESGALEEYLWYSDDKGASWSERIVVAADERYHLCEASILETRDEVLIAFLRENSSMGYDCFASCSYDHGSSWEGVYPLAIPGCHRPTAGYLQDGTILLTYRFFQGGKGAWQNVFAAFMPEESALEKKRTEQKIGVMPLDYDASAIADTGYTGWVQFDDGEIYVVSYVVDDAPKAQIRGYSFCRSIT